jgi:hypothetical protein
LDVKGLGYPDSHAASPPGASMNSRRFIAAQNVIRRFTETQSAD